VGEVVFHKSLDVIHVTSARGKIAGSSDALQLSSTAYCRRLTLRPLSERVRQKSRDPDDDEIDRDNIIEESRSDKNQDSCDQSDERLDEKDINGHVISSW